MAGDNRDPRSLGDRPGREQPCHKRKLDHIAVFHSTDYQPQDRWRDIHKPPLELHTTTKRIFCFNFQNKDHQPHYIDFHTTTPGAAVSIAHSKFQPSTGGWLGASAYFARSVDGIIGKARTGGGTYIIAKIRMGEVYEVHRNFIDKKHPLFNPQEYDFVHRSK
ncbi:unnamed protein product [Rotaria sp. Silwood2]|nr:unnamed protein product [Rotaria sp. Silwood2]CAF3058334.1 unnamed protein product [Rotaria sp. Silwood2]CAF3345832.1 unnamed protein product [Rotaria sp. Silwood2]CAF4267857.1 unnamed protein product [Rotaria sp. Silwood2]CAF4376414.1 unnamed protein product [Rotaria sp. Silwood2]